MREYNKKYRAEHREQQLEYLRRWRAELKALPNGDYRKEHHRQIARAAHKQWELRNPEKVRASKQRYYQANRERLLAERREMRAAERAKREKQKQAARTFAQRLRAYQYKLRKERKANEQADDHRQPDP